MKLRLFVALDLPAPARAALAAFRDGGGRPGRVAAGARRGAAPDARLPRPSPGGGRRAVADVLQDARRRRAPRLTLGRALALPPRRPRVLTAAIVDHDGDAGGRCRRGSAASWRPRALRARGAAVPPARDGGAAAAGRAGAARASCRGPAPLDLPRRGADALRSQLRRDGARYEPLARLPLREWSSHCRAPGPAKLAAMSGARALGGDDRRGGAGAARRRRARARRGCAGRAAATSRPSARRCACRSTAPGASPGAVRLRIARYARRAGGRRCSTSPAARAARGWRSSPTCCSRSAAWRARFELVSYDQRGTGASGLLRCRALERDARLRSTRAGADCAARLGARRGLLHDARLGRGRRGDAAGARRGEADAVRHLLRHEARARLRARAPGPRRADRARLGARARRRRRLRARAATGRWGRRWRRSARRAAAA